MSFEFGPPSIVYPSAENLMALTKRANKFDQLSRRYAADFETTGRGMRARRVGLQVVAVYVDQSETSSIGIDVISHIKTDSGFHDFTDNWELTLNMRRITQDSYRHGLMIERTRALADPTGLPLAVELQPSEYKIARSHQPFDTEKCETVITLLDISMHELLTAAEADR